jgi:hypothetical protein
MSPLPDSTGYQFFTANGAGNILLFVTCAMAG